MTASLPMIRAIVGASLAAFGVLLALAWPGVTWFDGGELAAAGATLGIAHPTGFPAWTLLAHVASLLPVGELAFRVTALSAALTATAGGLVAWAAWRLSDRPEALAAVALVPFARLVFPHAVAVEVYALHAASTAALLALVTWLSVAGDRRRIGAAALAVGLMLGGHGEMRLMVLPALAAVLWMRRGDITPGVLAAAGALCALGLAVHLSLPIRSAAGAVRDWARPDTAGALFDHLIAARIRLAFSDRMFSPTGTDWARFAEQVLPTGVPMLAFAAAGLSYRRIAPIPALTAGALLVIDVLYSVGVNPMGLIDEQNGQPTFIVLGLLAAALIPRLITPLVLMFPILALVVPPGDIAPRRYGTDALAQVGPHGLLMTTTDHLSSVTLWLRDVEGARPDAFHLVRQHAWVPVHAQGLAALVRRGDTPATLARRESALRSVRWEHGGGREEATLLDVLDSGVPTFAVGGEGGEIADPLRYGPRVAADQFNRLGLDAALRGAPSHGMQLFDVARRTDPQSPAAHLNLGTLASMMGRVDEAVAHTKRALVIAPDSAPAWVNLGRYELVRRDNAAAGEAFERARDLDPSLAAAWSGLGAVQANRGHRRQASELLLKALELDPGLDEARINLGKLTGPRPAGPADGPSGRPAPSGGPSPGPPPQDGSAGGP